MPFTKGFAGLTRERDDKSVIAVGQIHYQEVRRLRHTTDNHFGLAKVGLGVAGWMRKRHEHLLPAHSLLANVILDDGVATVVTMLIA